MSPRPTVFLNAEILDPEAAAAALGGLLVIDGKIAAVGPDVTAETAPETAERIDCAGHLLAPGLVDMLAHVGEPGAEHQETFETAGLAAAAGGVTTLAAMPDTDPVIDNVPLVEYVARRARAETPVNIYPLAAVTKQLAGQQITEMGLLKSAGARGFTDADRSVADAAVMRRALAYASAHDCLLIQHLEEPSLARHGVMNEGELATRLGLAGTPGAAEVIMIERDLRLVEVTGGRYHAGVVSTAESVAVIRAAKARGVKVTCGTAPHYMALNELAVNEYRTFAKTAPPLRAESDRSAVVAGVADGTIDVICSAHRPQDSESKRLPFAQAAFGVIGLETLLPVTLQHYHNGDVPLGTLFKALTATPAALLSLDCGRLRPGGPADLIVIDLNRAWRIDADDFLSKSKNSAFDQKPVQGQVLRTFVGGAQIFQKPMEVAA